MLIPVSFLVTVGEQFEEFIVEFRDPDPNENDEHQGQSVTQQCRSYIFDLNNRVRLRLIDAPGIGDIRGVTEDVKHMDHILTYANSLSHLNAICLFLKPNSTQLNVFFSSCLNHLLTYLTPASYNNLIFCFTNTKDTHYTSGDTGPLLRKMLDNAQLEDISTGKENTFCFDSESFRYLAARKCDIDFDDNQKKEYKISWNTSVTEAIRLLNFIQTNKPYCLEEWISPRQAVLDIYLLARPLMETLRLIIYNCMLSGNKLITNRIALNSDSIAVDICTRCAQIDIIEIGSYWICQYQLIPLKPNIAQHSRCRLNGKQFLIENIIQHEFVAQPTGLKNELWENDFHDFLFQCDRLLHFLRQQEPLIQNDPFDSILKRFLEEERQISEIHDINSNMNRRVGELLLSIRHLREQNSQQLSASNERLSLSEVYQIINDFMNIPLINKQVDSIKKTRQLKMTAYENKIPASFITNRTFV